MWIAKPCAWINKQCAYLRGNVEAAFTEYAYLAFRIIYDIVLNCHDRPITGVIKDNNALHALS